MLRRRLLITLAFLTMLMLGTALSSVLLMQRFLGDLESINEATILGATVSSNLGESIATIEAELLRWPQSTDRNTDLLNESSKSMNRQIENLRSYYSTQSAGQDSFNRLDHAWRDLSAILDAVITSSSHAESSHTGVALSSTNLMRDSILNHTNFAFSHMKSEQLKLAGVFRLMAIGLAAIFVVLINVSIILLIRSASYVLKPVDSLLEASRHLAREEYDYRVSIGRNDEFSELAEAFNHLAENLESNEQRKLEMLHQVARTLNHELNNAIAIIELQLRIVTKSPDYNPASSKQLELIHDTLHKMNITVTSLTHVRRVVLTDYIKGVQMLDLKLSTQQPADSKIPDEASTP